MAASVNSPLAPRFADAFWDEQHYGVDVIDQRLANAKQTCEEIKNLYELRSQMEGEYGDRLLKLSQLIVGQSDDGTLAESLSHIPSALETTARAHMDLAQQLLHHLQSPLDGFIKEQGELYATKRRRIQDKIKARNESYEHMNKAKDDYIDRCARLKEIYRYLEEYTSSPDEQAQAEADRDTCLESINLAEQVYRQSLDNYNNHTMTWVDDWRGACDVYQQLEEKRIRFIRSSLWAFANMMSSVYIVDDQCCERIRTALELTDVDKDIQTFAEKHGTGKQLPGFVEFEDAMPHMSPVHASIPPISDSNHEQQQQNSMEVKDLSTLSISTNHKGVESPEHYTPTQNHDTGAQLQLQQESPQQHHHQSDAMAFAMQTVENMLQEDHRTFRQSTDSGTPMTPIERNSAPQQTLASSQGRTINDSKPPNTPQPAGLMSTMNTKRPSSVKSFESGGQQLRFKPVPNPAFASRNKENQTDSRSADNAVKEQHQLSHNSNDYDNDQQLAELISTAALVAAGNDEANKHHSTTTTTYDTKPKEVVNEKDDIIQLTDDESEDGNNIPVRTPPKDEKWVISSIRRPQMVPVRSTNAHLYDGTPTTRTSMIQSSIAIADVNSELRRQQQQHRQSGAFAMNNDQHTPTVHQETTHEPGTNGKINRPHPALKIDIPNKNETKAAAQEAIAAGRAHTQNGPQPQQQIYSHPPPPQQQQSDTVGIRPPPWQQEGLSSTAHHQSLHNEYEASHHDQRYSHQLPLYSQHQQQHQLQGNGGLQRYGSVSGPRMAPPIITTDLDNDNGKTGKNGNEFSKFMKGVLKPNDDPASGKLMASAPPQELTTSTSTNKKDKTGRFSLGIFGGNKKDKEKRGQKDGRDSATQRTPPPGDILISGPPGGGPVVMPGDENPVNSYYNNSNHTNYHNGGTNEHTRNSNNGRPMVNSSTVIPTTQPVGDSNDIPNKALGHSFDHSHHTQQPQQKQDQANGTPTGTSTLQPEDSLDNKKQLSDGTPIMHFARAVWSFTATIPLEMSFSAGDRLAIVKKQADGWWDAELQGPTKTRGLVPGNYMEMD